MKYQITPENQARLSAWHYHKPHTDQPERYELINKITREAAELMMGCCPPSRQLSLALTKLEESRMWANNAIACTEET